MNLNSEEQTYLMSVFKTKKREREFIIRSSYLRFLSNSIPTIAIEMIIATTEANRYVIRSPVVTKFVWAVAVGVGVAGGSETAKYVCAKDGP